MTVRVEWGVALALSLVILTLHLVVLRHAGGLWRDEVNTVEMAAMAPTAMWSHLSFESFPVLWILVLRGWMSTGLGREDAGLRRLGMLVGMGVLGALWYGARQVGGAVPLVSLLLFGLSPVALRYGDSVRAYGLGIILILLTFGFVWRLVRAPTRGWFVLAAVTALLSVQCLYQNTFLLAGICSGALVVTLRRRAWPQSWSALAVGALTAASLLPYLGPYRRAQLSMGTLQSDVGVSLVLRTLATTLASPSSLMLALWIGFVALGVVAAVWALGRPAGDERAAERKELALFALTTLGASVLLYTVFLKLSSFSINPWHYVALMAVVAACLDAIIAATVTRPMLRLGLAAVVTLAAVLLALDVGEPLRVRQTNVDLIAARLNRVAREGDLIVVTPWYVGITFQHYYHGLAAWTTLPPMDDLLVHRHDLLKEAMRAADPIRPVLMRMGDALSSGRLVWLVVDRPILDNRHEPPPPPPVPDPVWGWSGGRHMLAWARQAGYYLQTHAAEAQRLDVPTEDPVSPFENLALLRVAGLRR